jgi:hypothetical protein
MSELDDIEKGLWTGAEGADKTLLRQYELYVHQAEQISARRHSASMIFIVASLAVVLIGAFFGEQLSGAGAAAFYLAGMLTQILWFLLARSYRNLNSAKFKVIGLMEKRLPASPFWAAEWKALGEGKDWRSYIPVSAIEHTAPTGFVILFLMLWLG